jgi:hypothetical protein
MATAKTERLVSTVHAFNEDTGGYEILAGGTAKKDVPAWAVKAMGDHVWVKDDGSDSESDES